MNEVDLFRHNELIDPHLEIWGWEIPVYLFLGGLTAGLMILGALLALRRTGDQPSRWARWLPFLSPVMLSVGMLALFLDLAFKLHVVRFYLAFRPLSPMSWGSWILIAIYPATILSGLSGLEDREVEWLGQTSLVRGLRLRGLLQRTRAWARERAAGLAWVNLVLGVGLGAYTGLLLGTLAARAAWSSTILGPLFLVSGLSTGAAFLMLLPLTHAEHQRLRGWDVGAIGTELALLALFLLDLGVGGGERGREAAWMFVGGRYTGAFWALVVLGGLAVPLAIELLESRRKLRPTVMAPVLVLIGGLSLRWILVLAGQA
jgi:formate-dependent nitrite reductase membrane component NrfD